MENKSLIDSFLKRQRRSDQNIKGADLLFERSNCHDEITNLTVFDRIQGSQNQFTQDSSRQLIHFKTLSHQLSLRALQLRQVNFTWYRDFRTGNYPLIFKRVLVLSASKLIEGIRSSKNFLMRKSTLFFTAKDRIIKLFHILRKEWNGNLPGNCQSEHR